MIFKSGDWTHAEFPCEIIRRIPGGYMAELYLAKLKNTNHVVVVKGVSEQAEQIQKSTLVCEAGILKQLRKESIPEFFGYYEEAERSYYIMSYHSGMDLERYMFRKHVISEETVKEVALSVCRTLAYLHKKGIVYGDLKPSNLLLTEAGDVVLLDYGAAGYIHGEEKVPFFRGTLGYAAPECWSEEKRQYKAGVDIFALGATLFFLLEGSDPKEHFGKLTLTDVQKKNRWQSVLNKCCALDTDRRYQSIAQVYEVINKISF